MSFYSESQRGLQEQFDSVALADRMELGIIATELTAEQAEFITRLDFFFLSSVDADGAPTVSYKGGDVGVVRVLDDGLLAFPAYDGNGMFLSVGNIEDTAKIGMLFIDFETPQRLRVQATASFDAHDTLMAEFPGSIGIVRAAIDQVFPNCARYIHPHQRRGASSYVPASDGSQPLPSWKRIDVLQDVLSSDVQEAVADAGGVITGDEYGERLRSGTS